LTTIAESHFGIIFIRLLVPRVEINFQGVFRQAERKYIKDGRKHEDHKGMGEDFLNSTVLQPSSPRILHRETAQLFLQSLKSYQRLGDAEALS
jgi:hypothetical protein